MSLLSPMYTNVSPVQSAYTPDALGVFARMPFLVNGHTCVPAHGIAASLLLLGLGSEVPCRAIGRVWGPSPRRFSAGAASYFDRSSSNQPFVPALTS